jgi:hypothetical protein
MEEAINNLLQQGIIDEDQARHVLMKASDEGFAIGENDEVVTAGGRDTKGSQKVEEGGYSF